MTASVPSGRVIRSDLPSLPSSLLPVAISPFSAEAEAVLVRPLQPSPRLCSPAVGPAFSYRLRILFDILFPPPAFFLEYSRYHPRRFGLRFFFSSGTWLSSPLSFVVFSFFDFSRTFPPPNCFILFGPSSLASVVSFRVSPMPQAFKCYLRLLSQRICISRCSHLAQVRLSAHLLVSGFSLPRKAAPA